MKDRKVLIRILMSFQIVLGIIWIFACGFTVVLEPDTVKLIAAASTGYCDDYTGFIYPLMLRPLVPMFSCGVTSALSHFAHGIVFVLQLLALFWSFVYMLCQLNRQGVRANMFYSAYVISFPFILQSAAMISKRALLLSVLAIGIGLGVRAALELKNSRKWIMLFAAYIAVIVSLVLVDEMNSDSGVAMRSPNSLETGLMITYALENGSEDYFVWPEAIREMIPYEDINAITANKENGITKLSYYIYPKQESDFEIGKVPDSSTIDVTNRLYLQMALSSMKNRSKQTLLVFAKKTAEYTFAPYTYILNTKGYGKSITKLRLNTMQGKVPLYGRFYSYFGILLSTVVGILVWKKQKCQRSNSVIILTLLYAVFFALFDINDFDYLNMLPIYMLWLSLGFSSEMNEK